MSVREPSANWHGEMGARIDGAKMAECVWIKPELVAAFEFLDGRTQTMYVTSNSLLCETTKIRTRSPARKPSKEPRSLTHHAADA